VKGDHLDTASFCVRLDNHFVWRNVAIIAMKLWQNPNSLTDREWLVALYALHWTIDKAVFSGELLVSGEADLWRELTGTIENWLNETTQF
jgi:hypothetical protein